MPSGLVKRAECSSQHVGNVFSRRQSADSLSTMIVESIAAYTSSHECLGPTSPSYTTINQVEWRMHTVRTKTVNQRL